MTRRRKRDPGWKRGARSRPLWTRLFLLSLCLSPCGCQSGGDHGRAVLGLAPGGHPGAECAFPGEGLARPDPIPDIPAATAERTIDLETALGLAGVDNPTIALALEAVRASRAEQLQAQSLLLPTLNAGVDFDLHRGNLESASGTIFSVNRQSLYAGAGAAAVGAGPVGVPGVRIFSHLADALYEPRAARQRVEARRFEAAATGNAILLEVASRFFDLAGAEVRLQAVRQSEQEVGAVAKLTADFARAGQGRQGDADRARSEALLLEAVEKNAQEEVVVAAAELSRLLNTDPSVRLRGPGDPLPTIRLIDPAMPLGQLVELALANRPEIRARQAEIARAETLLREEKVRPFLPLLSAGFSAGDFGGGSNLTSPGFGHFGGRIDVDVSAVWTLENFGLGNLATQRQRRAAVNAAVAERLLVVDQVRQEVAEAYGWSEATRRQVETARRQLRSARDGFRLDLERARNIEGRPIEVLNSANLLAAARQEMIRALVGYNQAQFRLFVALGQPPVEALSRAWALPVTVPALPPPGGPKLDVPSLPK